MGNCCTEGKGNKNYNLAKSQKEINKSNLNHNITYTHQILNSNEKKNKSVSIGENKNKTAISNSKNKNNSTYTSNFIPYNSNNKNFPNNMKNNNKLFSSNNKKNNNQINISSNNKYIPNNYTNNINNNKIINAHDIIYGNNVFLNNNNKNTFPKGTKYEKELNSNFKYFNVFWYDPNKTNDLTNFINCFENVQCFFSNDLESAINLFKKQSIFEWIVITPGKKGEELIYNLQIFENIKAFFIFCGNIKYHEQWVKKYNKVFCLTSNPEILCQKLIEFIEINKNYICPNFNYNSKENISININGLDSEKLFGLKSPKIKNVFEYRKGIKYRYYNFCLNSHNYLKSKRFENDFNDNAGENYSTIYVGANILKKLKEEDKDAFESIVYLIRSLTLLSLYFDQYPYLYNSLSFQEIKNIFEKDDMSSSFVLDYDSNLKSYSKKLYFNLIHNKCILDEKDMIKCLHEALIYNIIFNISLIFEQMDIDMKHFSFFTNYYQIINFFRDIDFCLKLYLTMNYGQLTTEKHDFAGEIYSALNSSEPRFIQYSLYQSHLSEFSSFDSQTLNIINNTLTIKNFIILGDKIFHQKIKTIEKHIKNESFQYLNPDQITYYLDLKKKEKAKTIVPYFYLLIIKYEEFIKNFENFAILCYRTGIFFLVFLYIENENITKIIKNKYYGFISIIFVYSPNDILKYLSQKLNFNNPLDNPLLENIFNIEIPKITFEQSPEDKYQDGCFELSETFDIDLIKNKFLLCLGQEIDFISEFRKNIYYIYKEHNALDIFFNQNCVYLGWNLYPDIIEPNICFVKRFLYLYCREENPSEKSLYRIINDDLRSRESYKIYRYINILALINKIIDEGDLASYKGTVYRATKLDEKLIMKLIPGIKMVNTTFWSTSKDFKVAENFMIKQNFRNAFIICKTIKNNIDIDVEKLNPFNEKEVLFLPFTEFIVNKISSRILYSKKVFIIELTELGNKNFVNPNNMKIGVVNGLSTKNLLNILVQKAQIICENLPEKLSKSSDSEGKFLSDISSM